LLLVCGSGRGAVVLVQAQLGERNIVESGSLGELSPSDRKQQRLHDQRTNRGRGNQPSPEGESGSDLISRGSHAHELILMDTRSHRKPANRKGVHPGLSIVGTMGGASPIACCRSGIMIENLSFGRNKHVLIGAPLRAEEVKAGDLVITQAWSRATPGGAKVGGGYLTIENKGSTPDRLIGGSAEVAGKVQVHEMAMNNGVMTMRPLDKGLVIEPGKTVKLAPGGYHLMLLDLKSPLKQGEKVPLTLEFEKAGKIALSLDVQGVGAQGPAGSEGSDGQMDMKKMPDHSGMKM
jgi:copper(I)-binding protein